jgi:hypothetical protein
LKGTRLIDKYALFWSPRPEFVRAAARFGATIVPFGAIGCDESQTAIMNADNLKRVVNFISRVHGGPDSSESREDFVRLKARKGVNAHDMFEDDISPVR